MCLVSTLSQRDLQSDWDCIVIGGGPAGAMAGHRAAVAGLRTLIVERKSFPRAKVCGACVNQRALSVLHSVGLSRRISELGGRPVNRFCVRAGGQCLNVPLPQGMAISRAVFDHTLVQAAVEAGAHFLPETTAQVQPQTSLSGDSDGRRDVPCLVKLNSVFGTHTSQASESAITDITARSKVVIAADGLGHPSLKLLPQFTEQIAEHSRIGAGTLMRSQSSELPAGTIHMAVGSGGYAGLVRVEDGQLNIAAALNPEAVRKCGQPGDAVQEILQQAGLDSIDVTSSVWTGTPQLTRRTSCVADGSVFVVGDAAGYVEPFTGEGIAWALVGGVGVAECAAEAVLGSPQAAAKRWQRLWKRQVLQRQTWCRRLAWLLKFSAAAPTVVRLASLFPGVTRPIVTHLNAAYHGGR